MATIRIRRINPVQLATVTGVIYGLLGFLITPLVFIGSMFSGSRFPPLGVGLALFMPIIYGLIGAVGTFIAALVYNLVAGWVGGVEFDIENS